MKDKFLEKLKKGICSMSEMSEHLNVKERQVRKIAESIKKENLQNAKNGWLLVSGNFGYKISKDVNEIKEYVQRMYNMAMSILVQSNEAKKFLSHEDSKKLGILFEEK